MKMNKLIAVALILCVIGGIFFLFVSDYGMSNLTVSFYDDQGARVGSMNFNLVPLAAVTVGGVEVEYFTLTLGWYTDHPEATAITWTVNIRVWYLEPDVVPVQERVVFDGLCWQETVGGDREAERLVPGVPGERTSGNYYISAYAETGVPEETTFFIEFSGNAKFFDTIGVGMVLAEVLIAPVRIQCHHESFTYTAILYTGI
jgi:hypothetical protein